MDPFLSLLLAAEATTSLRVGTSVALPLEHDLFALAKSVATLDRLSGGRFDFGVGVGWNVEELADHRPDIAWPSRYRALEECITALKVLWRDEEAEHHGRWFDFDPVWSEPKPLQDPHPPIAVGMAGRLGTAHAVAWGDQWMPMDLALGNVAKRVERFRQAVADAGRPPLPIILMTWGDPTLDDPRGLPRPRHRTRGGRTGPRQLGRSDAHPALPRSLCRARPRARRADVAQTTAPACAQRSDLLGGAAELGEDLVGVLSEARDGLGHGRLAAGEAHRVPRLAHGAGLGVLPRDERAVVDDLLILEHLLRLEDAGHRDLRLDEVGDHLVDAEPL